MIIKNNGLNSMPQQVQENMENIKLLASYLKEAYNSSIDLGDSAVSIAISDTNATADTIDGWLVSQDGYLYKITSGDGTNLLLEYYTRLQGRNGSEDIDDNTTSLNKLWSSKKTSDKIDLISDKGIYYTLVQPTLNGSFYELNTSDLANPNQYTYQKINNIIVYIDSDEKVKELYNCVAIQGDFSKIYLEKIGEIGGKQLYQHNIRMHTSNLSITITITSTDNTAFTKSSINTWLSDKGFTGASPNYETYNLGFVYSTGNDKLVSQGIAFRSGNFTYKNIVGSFTGINDADITFDSDKIITI